MTVEPKMMRPGRAGVEVPAGILGVGRAELDRFTEPDQAACLIEPERGGVHGIEPVGLPAIRRPLDRLEDDPPGVG
jgi:hypothetical protein